MELNQQLEIWNINYMILVIQIIKLKLDVMEMKYKLINKRMRKKIRKFKMRKYQNMNQMHLKI